LQLQPWRKGARAQHWG